jgi:hypothetical protein
LVQLSVLGKHGDLEKMAKLNTGLTLDQMKGLPRDEQDDLIAQIKSVRKAYKAANYSCVYGVGAMALARSTGLSVKQAKVLIDAYWERNWAIKEVAEEQETRTIGDVTWIKNPVSKFWYNLRSEKDRWSTINQSTGVFCFDTWLAFARAKGVKVVGQFHDEVICVVESGKESDNTDKLKAAMVAANKKLNLNVELGIDIQYGSNYAEIH